MPRRALLTSAQRDALMAVPADEATLARHWVLGDPDLRAIARRRRPHNRLGFAVQLCALRYPGRLLRPGELIPPAALAFLGGQLAIEAEALARYAARGPTRYEQLGTLRDLFGFTPLSRPDRTALQAWLLPIALTTTSGADVARALMAEFRRRRIIIPGISIIERMAAEALLGAERHVETALTGTLNVVIRDDLDALLQLRPGSAMSVLAWVRQPPGMAGHRAFAEILDRITTLRAIGIKRRAADDVHPERLRQLAQEGARLSAQHLAGLQPARRHTVLAATVLETTRLRIDDAVLMFDRIIGRQFRRAERRAEAALKRDRRTINGKIQLFARLGEALIEARRSGEDVLDAVEAIVGWDQLGQEVREARDLLRPDALDPIELAAASHPLLRRIGPAFVTAFAFGAVPACTALLRAVATLRDLHTGLLRKLPEDAPFAFVRQSWRRRIGGAPIDRQLYAFCVYVELRDRLRAGDVWVEGSRRYRSIEDQLIPPALFAALQAANPLPIPAPRSAAAWLTDRRALLDRRLADVGRKAELHALEDVLLADGRMRITPLKAVTPVDAEAALAPLYSGLPSIRITDLLSEVDRWTGFTVAFTHLHSGRAAEDPRVTLAAVLADATDLGHRRIAEACDLVSQRQLAWLAAWHLREETYGRALGVLVDAQHRLPLAARFGAGSSSSSDGQHFPLDRRAQATGAINPHKGSEAAVSFYTHVSDRYAPFHSKVISATAGEAAHVLDGLLHHAADLAIEEHHVDGGGVSDHVFALCHLLGFRFAPRIPNIGKRRLHLFRGQDPGTALGPFVASRIDADLIESHWPDLLRLAVSIRTGVVSASLMLERLGAYPRANGLALALREIGRLERTLFTLDWIESPEQRRRATRELNKGEAENALKRAIFFHRVGRIRDHGLQAQSHRASAVNLVACAIVLWNTTYLQAAIERLSAAGRPVPDEHLAHLSPLGWRHINLTGDYLWADDGIPADRLRPLRRLSDLPE